MKSLILVLLWVPYGMADTNTGKFRYISPVPGSALVSPGNNIVIAYNEELARSSFVRDLLEVRGSVSGVHTGDVVFSGEGSLIFVPHRDFASGENIEVSLSEGMTTIHGEPVPGLGFGFTVSATSPDIARQYVEETGSSAIRKAAPDNTEPPLESSTLCDTLIPGYPTIDLLVQNNPDPGYLFVSPFPGVGAPGHMMILDDQAAPVFYRQMPTVALDFEKQESGLLTYYDFREVRKYFVMDSSYNIVDSIQSGNGYPMTDGHELEILSNGNIILMIYDIQTVRMDTIVAGGDSAAQVVGLVLQEMDPDRNVLFQWRSWDHFSILDGEVSGLVALDSNWIDYVHGNSIEIDLDGNWIISSRHMNEITKIDRGTGEIIWRLGLNAVNNDFTFINDSRGFSHQHDARRLANGNLTLYDNGNFLVPEYSRALEYELDEQNMTATLVWEYRNDPDSYGAFMGSVQRLPSGKSLIAWGGTFIPPGVTEVHPDDTKAFEIAFPGGSYSYRAYRYDWQTNMFTTNRDSVDFGLVSPGDSSLQALSIVNNSNVPVAITCMANGDSAFIPYFDPPVTIPPHSSIGLTVKFVPGVDGDYTDYLYIRSVSDTTLVARRVVLEGTTFPTSVGNEEGLPNEYMLYQNYPNPFNPATTIGYDISRATHARISVFNVLGQEIEVLVDDFRSPGSYSIVWKAHQQPSGVYFYRMETNGYTSVKKLLLMR